MKLKRILLSLSLAGLGLSQVGAQEHQLPPGFGQGRSISDVDEVQTSEVSITRNAQGGKTLSDTPSYATALDMSIIAPTTASYASCDGDCGGSCGSVTCGCEIYECDSGCDTSCDDGCDGLFGGGALAGGVPNNVWFTGEVLLWFTESLKTAPLVATSPQGVFPALAPTSTATTAWGGPNGIDTGLLPGFRFEGGIWGGEDDMIGVSGRILGTQSIDEYSRSSNGAESIGLPMFNVNPAFLREDAFIVAFTAPGNIPVASGGVDVRSDLDLFQTEGSLRILLGESDDHRVEMLGGYTYSRLTSSLTVNASTTNLFTGDAIPDGTVFDTHDLFETENEFHGGHVGILSTVTRSSISLSTLAKVSFGNMSSSGEIRGHTTTSFGGNSTSAAGGVFTTPGNIGVLATADNFAFIPEMGVKLGYEVQPGIKLTAGYTFMYWSSVALAGEQMDRVIDPLGTVARPTGTLQEGSLWMQGLDLGLSVNY